MGLQRDFHKVVIINVIFVEVLDTVILELNKQEENIPSRDNRKDRYFYLKK